MTRLKTEREREYVGQEGEEEGEGKGEGEMRRKKKRRKGESSKRRGRGEKDEGKKGTQKEKPSLGPTRDWMGSVTAARKAGLGIACSVTVIRAGGETFLTCGGER